MKVVEETPTRLVLRRRPWVLWIIGILFTGMGILVGRDIFAGGGFGIGGELWIQIFVIGGIGMGFTLLPNVVTCTVDLGLHQLTLRHAGLMGVREETHSLDEIIDFVVDVSTDSDGDTYRAIIVLHAQEEVPLTNYYTSNKKGWHRTVDKLREFTGIGNQRP